MPAYWLTPLAYLPYVTDPISLPLMLLLTSYGASEGNDTLQRLTRGLVRQFALAFMAQMTNEERRKQAYLLEELNEELSQERDGLQQQRDLVRRIIESIHEGMSKPFSLVDLEMRVKRLLELES